MTNENLRFFALSAMALGQTCFALLYVTFPWWRNFLGRALFAKALSLMVLLDFFIFANLFDFRDVDGVYTTLYFFVAATIWAQFIAFLRVKRDAPRIKREFYDSQSDHQDRFPETRTR